MENIVQSNNRDLRLVAVKVGVLSTLRLALPDVPANATRVEVIVTNGDTHTAYGAHLNTETERWLVDVAAEQFPSCGKQKYEIAYLLDGKQFWDGAGWVTVEDATTGGLTPSPSPDPARYVVTRINGYGAPNPDGEVRIPRTFVGTEDPTTTDTFIEFDQFFNSITGALFVLCSVGGTLTWVQIAGAISSVNGKVGAVVLGANDVGAYSRNETNAALANKLDKTAVVAPSASATEGQAADAKATHDALTGKLDSGEAILEKDAYGLTDGSRVFGFFVRKNGGIFIGTAGGIVEIPYLRPGTMALDVDIADATKLTPVWSFSNVSDELRTKMPFSMRYGEEFGGWEIYGADGIIIDGIFRTSKTDTVVDFAVGMSATNSGIIATIIGYTTVNGENLMSGTDDAKAALFAGAAFREAVRACFGDAETTEYGTEA